MRKAVIPILLAVAFTVTGCDFFRFVAGRPTSGEIEAKRTEIQMVEKELEEARIKAVNDSLAKVKKAQEDSLAAMDSIRKYDIRRYAVASFSGVRDKTLTSRYYIAVGSFKTEENARKFMMKVSEAGYSPEMMRFVRGGLYTVTICPSETIADCVASLLHARTYDFCPADAWILTNL